MAGLFFREVIDVGQLIDTFIPRRSQQLRRKITPLAHLREELNQIKAELEKLMGIYQKINDLGRRAKHEKD